MIAAKATLGAGKEFYAMHMPIYFDPCFSWIASFFGF